MRTLTWIVAVGLMVGGLGLLPACGGGGGEGDAATNPETTATTGEPPTIPHLTNIATAHALAPHPTNGTALAISAVNGDMRILAPLQADAPVVGVLTLRLVRAAAYGTDDTVFAMTKGGTGTDDALHRIDVGDAASTEVGAVTGALIRALAFDGASSSGVLYGFDANGGKLVTIDTSDASLRPIGQAIGRESIDTMNFDLATKSIVALERDTGALLDLSVVGSAGSGALPSGGAPQVSVQTIGSTAAENVRAIVIMPGTDEMLLVDTTRNEFLRVHRFTGDPLEALPAPSLHRGAGGDAPAALLWPRGESRAAGLHTYGIVVGEDFDGGTLVFKKGEKVLSKEPFDPDTTVVIARMPEAVTKAIQAGDTLTWGIFDAKQQPLVQTTCAPVDRPKAEAALTKIAANEYVANQHPVVRLLLEARALRSAGLHPEALRRFLAAATTDPAHKTAKQGLLLSIQKTNAAWGPGELLRWIEAVSKKPDASHAALMTR